MNSASRSTSASRVEPNSACAVSARSVESFKNRFTTSSSDCTFTSKHVLRYCINPSLHSLPFFSSTHSSTYLNMTSSRTLVHCLFRRLVTISCSDSSAACFCPTLISSSCTARPIDATSRQSSRALVLSLRPSRRRRALESQIQTLSRPPSVVVPRRVVVVASRAPRA